MATRKQGKKKHQPCNALVQSVVYEDANAPKYSMSSSSSSYTLSLCRNACTLLSQWKSNAAFVHFSGFYFWTKMNSILLQFTNFAFILILRAKMEAGSTPGIVPNRWKKKRRRESFSHQASPSLATRSAHTLSTSCLFVLLLILHPFLFVFLIVLSTPL